MISIVTGTLGLGLQTPAAGPPVFPTDFYVGVQNALAINQGGYYIQDGMCCSKDHASQCKLQGMNMGEDHFEQGSKKASRSDSAQGAIVHDYNISKEMGVVPGADMNSTHKWACAVYCPIKKGENFESVIRIGDGTTGPLDTPKDMGKQDVTQPASIGHTTKVCEHWKWSETLLKVIKMQTTDFFVDNTGKTPVPFFASSMITPFGKPFGQQNSSFIGYQAMDVSDYFDIDPASITSCKMGDKCNPPPPPPGAYESSDDIYTEEMYEHLIPSHMARQRLWPKKTILQEAEEVAKTMPAAVKAAAPSAPLPPQPNITFVGDFTAHEDSMSLISQGGIVVNNDPCCSSNGPGPQCQIQLNHRGGMRYLDVTNQRTRFEDLVGGQVMVDDYTAKKSMLLNVTNGVDTCQEYCPMSPDDSLEPLRPFDPFDKTVDKGATTMDGKAVEHYFWADKILKIITMSATDFYADISNKNAAIPVFLSNHMKPLGQDLGTSNQTWSQFKAGVPDAKKFKIAGVDTCPKSKNCGKSDMLLHHAQTRNYHTLASLLEHRVPYPVMK